MADSDKRRRRQFSKEFKRDAVELVRTCGRPIAQIAPELGIYDSTLGQQHPDHVRTPTIHRGDQLANFSDRPCGIPALGVNGSGRFLTASTPATLRQ
jgi:hypothetical protein